MGSRGQGISRFGPRTVRGSRRVLAPFAGAALALALLAGCGGADEAPAEDPENGTAAEAPTGETAAEEPTDGTATEESTSDGGATSTDDDSDPEDTEDADDPGHEADDDPAGTPEGENHFEGSWTLHHDSKVLSAEELADLIEEEAEAHGPEEMSLDVECADGVDTVAGDDTAECIAYADEGVEHPWAVSVGPADAGLVIEVENVG
jgi:hypothetical protein